MTLDEFAASRPDLANNWRNAHDPAYADDPNVPAILQFATFADYLENDYGQPFDQATPTAAESIAPVPSIDISENATQTAASSPKQNGH